MSTATAVHEVTAHLAELSAIPSPVESTRMGVDAALHGRGAALALARQVIEDVLKVSAKSPATLAELHLRPERVLVSALRVSAREARSYSPVEIVAAVDPRSAAARWERLGAAATQAHIAWTESPAKPSGAAGRAAVADVAVVALALAHLDRHVIQAATRAGVDDVARDLGFAQQSGLGLAARSVLRRAASDGAASWEAPSPQRLDRMPVVPVRGPEDALRGLQRLHDLLTAGASISPQHTAMLLTAQVRMGVGLAQQADRAARAMGEEQYAALADGLRRHVTALAGAWDRSDRAMAGLERPDPRPVQQAGECVRGLTVGAVPLALLEPTSAAVVRLAGATAAAVERRVESASWATCYSWSEAQESGSWRVVRTTAMPHVVGVLREVAASTCAVAGHGAFRSDRGLGGKLSTGGFLPPAR
ncbi:hypothetical protein [Kineococcus glutinatus]|uniref:DUF222 domain-containing protein n=1 Tax=Kineococcus glutinatus TaxID=1070872 RepID=A0ABP9HEM4_9ACTN